MVFANLSREKTQDSEQVVSHSGSWFSTDPLYLGLEGFEIVPFSD